MNLFINFLVQEYIGIMHLAFPILVLGYLAPETIINPYASLAIAGRLGLWRTFLAYQQAKNEAHVLQFHPSGHIKTELEALIESCNMDPKTIQLRYRYADDMVATTSLNLIGIDHMVWHGLDEDPEAVKAKQVIEQFIAPHWTPEQREKLSKIKQFLSPAAQRFIFRHELAHIHYQYTYKKLASVALIITLFTYASIRLGWYLYPQWGGAATIVALLAAGIIDIGLSYISNYFFKTWSEIQADHFAVHYSNSEEIIAAAEFFERYQEIIDASSKGLGILAYLPASLRAGYPESSVRGAYLRKFAATK